jgi:hypothetical protein
MTNIFPAYRMNFAAIACLPILMTTICAGETKVVNAATNVASDWVIVKREASKPLSNADSDGERKNDRMANRFANEKKSVHWPSPADSRPFTAAEIRARPSPKDLENMIEQNKAVVARQTDKFHKTNATEQLYFPLVQGNVIVTNRALTEEQIARQNRMGNTVVDRNGTHGGEVVQTQIRTPPRLSFPLGLPAADVARAGGFTSVSDGKIDWIVISTPACSASRNVPVPVPVPPVTRKAQRK